MQQSLNPSSTCLLALCSIHSCFFAKWWKRSHCPRGGGGGRGGKAPHFFPLSPSIPHGHGIIKVGAFSFNFPPPSPFHAALSKDDMHCNSMITSKKSRKRRIGFYRLGSFGRLGPTSAERGRLWQTPASSHKCNRESNRHHQVLLYFLTGSRTTSRQKEVERGNTITHGRK